MPTATTSMETIIAMMVGRTLFERAQGAPRHGPRVVLEVRNLNCGPLVKDVSFVVRKGEILGFAGLMGAGRTEVARAVFGADTVDSGEILVHNRKVSIRTPGDAVAHGIGYLSEDRKHFGLATGMDVESNIVLANLRRFLALDCLLSKRAIRDTAASFVKRLEIKTPSVAQKVAPALRRQPAEDRDRQMAGARLRDPVLRRADARHRHRRQERDLQAAAMRSPSRARRSS